LLFLQFHFFHISIFFYLKFCSFKRNQLLESLPIFSKKYPQKNAWSMRFSQPLAVLHYIWFISHFNIFYPNFFFKIADTNKNELFCNIYLKVSQKIMKFSASDLKKKKTYFETVFTDEIIQQLFLVFFLI